MDCWLGLRAFKTLYFYFCKVIKIERIFAKNFARNYEKKNTWNVRHLVNETMSQRIILKIVEFLMSMFESTDFKLPKYSYSKLAEAV